MKLIPSNNAEWLVVEVPEGAKDPWLLERYSPPMKLGYYIPEKIFGGEALTWSESIDLPPGKWSIYGRPGELTEEQWREIVEEEWGGFAGHIKGFADYYPKAAVMDGAPFLTATESGKSWLKANGIGDHCVILKKEAIA